MSLRELMIEARRLAILRLLLDDSDEAINDGTMQIALAAMGHGVDRDVVRDDYARLAALGLVELEMVGEKMQVARLTEHGANVAQGRAAAPGVKRHRPE